MFVFNKDTHLKKMQHASLALDKFWVGVSFTGVYDVVYGG
jgi:hypothetical protein